MFCLDYKDRKLEKGRPRSEGGGDAETPPFCLDKMDSVLREKIIRAEVVTVTRSVSFADKGVAVGTAHFNDLPIL